MNLRNLITSTLGFVLAGGLVACAGTSPSPAGSTAASPAGSSAASPAGGQAVCDDAAALRTAADELRALDVTAVGTDGLTAAVDEVRSAGSALKASAGSELAPSVTALETALAALVTAVEQVPEGSIGSGAGAEGIRTAIADVGTAATALQTQLASTSCPS